MPHTQAYRGVAQREQQRLLLFHVLEERLVLGLHEGWTPHGLAWSNHAGRNEVLGQANEKCPIKAVAVASCPSDAAKLDA